MQAPVAAEDGAEKPLFVGVQEIQATPSALVKFGRLARTWKTVFLAVGQNFAVKVGV